MVKAGSFQDQIIANATNTHIPNFDATRCRPHKNKSMTELVQSLVVFQLCQFQPLVQHGEKLLAVTRKILGDKMTDSLVRHTFFPQFCGGETNSQVVQKMLELQKLGINSILDYAAENEGPSNRIPSFQNGGINNFNQPTKEYDYESEKICDEHMESFRRCIQTANDAGNGRQFAAMKITGLGNPKLLKKMSCAVRHIQDLVNLHDEDKKGYLNQDEILKVARSLSDNNEMIDKLIDHLDPSANTIDYIDLSAAAFALDFQSERSKSFLDMIPDSVKFTAEEIDLIHALQSRANLIAQEASTLNVSLLIDAEQSWFQPAIDVISSGLQQKYNHVDVADQPVVFSTYQCYLKNSLERLNVDVSKSKRLSFHLGSKLVRGAYMPRERARAIDKGYVSPIHDSLQETHDCYNNAMEYLLRQMKSTKSPSIKVMCASHNRESIELSIKLFHELGLSNDSCDGLSFAQLYGMADDLTISLGENRGKGYNVYKYLPYGQIKEVVPYLLRRAQENADVLGKSKYEMELLFDELKDRCRIL